MNELTGLHINILHYFLIIIILLLNKDKQQTEGVNSAANEQYANRILADTILEVFKDYFDNKQRCTYLNV